jgi:hypothetical protein
VFPLYVRSYLNENENTVAPDHNIAQEAEPKEIWDMMFRLLTPHQREQVTGKFRAKGIDAVFPFVCREVSILIYAPVLSQLTVGGTRRQTPASTLSS